jgi:hypothetical protein
MMRKMTLMLEDIPQNDNASRRQHFHAKGAEVKSWRRKAALLLPPCGEPFPAATLHIDFGFTQNRRQGLDAYVGACKPIIDAFVDRGYLLDDGWLILRAITAEAHKATYKNVTLVLTEIPA